MRSVTIMILMVLLLPSCVKRISYYNRKERKLDEIEVETNEENLSEGSLWSERASNTSMFSEKKAHKINDIILVTIDESDKAQKKADTKLGRSSEASFGLTNGFGLWEQFVAKHKDMNASSLVATSSKNDFEGAGDTSRAETIDATITVVVKRVFRSGNLFIEGEKVTLVNGEEQHLYLSGIIRPEDISNDNRVRSDRIAELQVEFAGRGTVSDKQSPGFLSRALDWIWPF